MKGTSGTATWLRNVSMSLRTSGSAFCIGNSATSFDAAGCQFEITAAFAGLRQKQHCNASHLINGERS